MAGSGIIIAEGDRLRRQFFAAMTGPASSGIISAGRNRPQRRNYAVMTNLAVHI